MNSSHESASITFVRLVDFDLMKPKEHSPGHRTRVRSKPESPAMSSDVGVKHPPGLSNPNGRSPWNSTATSALLISPRNLSAGELGFLVIGGSTFLALLFCLSLCLITWYRHRSCATSCDVSSSLVVKSPLIDGSSSAMTLVLPTLSWSEAGSEASESAIPHDLTSLSSHDHTSLSSQLSSPSTPFPPSYSPLHPDVLPPRTVPEVLFQAAPAQTPPPHPPLTTSYSSPMSPYTSCPPSLGTRLPFPPHPPYSCDPNITSYPPYTALQGASLFAALPQRTAPGPQGSALESSEEPFDHDGKDTSGPAKDPALSTLSSSLARQETLRRQSSSEKLWGALLMSRRGETSCGLGSITFRVQYDPKVGILRVTLLSATSLPDRFAKNSADSYAKMALLPDKRVKYTTRVIRGTVDPVFRHTFSHSATPGQLAAQALRFSVCQLDRLGRRVVVGYAVVPLATVGVRAGLTRTLDTGLVTRNLQDTAPDQQETDVTGEVTLSLKWDADQALLTYTVHRLTHLRLPSHADPNGTESIYCKLTVYRSNDIVTWRRTRAYPRVSCITMEEDLSLELGDDLGEIYTVLSVRDKSKTEGGGRRVLGCALVGLGASVSEQGREHWLDMMRAAGDAVYRTYTLV
ncbi:uncharacterized protein LOC143040407 isoform X2 [Oratosquilla oratoria]|uniref:uncharacterized protein LOC143040407 isoform X2 n=1 Tax=Oratosquilla oratoria TaxID=337810 RepID=UPI003F759449